MDKNNRQNQGNHNRASGNPIKKEGDPRAQQVRVEGAVKQNLTPEQKKALLARQQRAKNLTPEQKKALLAKQQGKGAVNQISPEERKRLAKEEFLRKKKLEREARIKAGRHESANSEDNILWTEDRIQQIIQEVRQDNVLMEIAEVKTAIEFMTTNVSKLALLHKFKKQKKDQLDKLGFTMR